MSATTRPEDEKMEHGGRSIMFVERVIYVTLTFHTPTSKQLFKLEAPQI